MLKTALVGLGNIGMVHASNWADVKHAKLAAACDINAACFDKIKDLNIPVYTDINKMLREQKPDIVDICTPTDVHVALALTALDAGCHVLLEKPIALDKRCVDTLYGAAAEKGKKLMIAHVVRFWDEYAGLREIIRSGTYGKVLNGHFLRMGEAPKGSWMLDKAKSGLVPFDLHIHDLDFLIYTFGRPLSWKTKRCERENSDYMFAAYDYGGFFIHCEAAWFNAKYPFQYRFRVELEEAVVEAVDGRASVYTSDGGILPISDAVKNETGLNPPLSNAYAKELYYFADCVEKDLPVDRVPGADVKTALEILETI